MKRTPILHHALSIPIFCRWPRSSLLSSKKARFLSCLSTTPVFQDLPLFVLLLRLTNAVCPVLQSAMHFCPFQRAYTVVQHLEDGRPVLSRQRRRPKISWDLRCGDEEVLRSTSFSSKRQRFITSTTHALSNVTVFNLGGTVRNTSRNLVKFN